MSTYHRFFLVIEGAEEGYPNYQNAKITFSTVDPGNLRLSNLFVCSPLFSICPAGVKRIPDAHSISRIFFLMIPNVYPAFDQIFKKYFPQEEVWYSLGLANLVVLEEKGKRSLAEDIIKDLKEAKNLTGFEIWNVESGVLSRTNPRIFSLEHSNKNVENFDISISEKLPLHIKFSVSEYIISINKILTASKKFTPHYYPHHLKTIEVSKELVSDLSFLYYDNTFSPSSALIKTLNASSADEAFESLRSGDGLLKREELINDRNGRLVQFNSSMSYIYSQAFAGTFPIFDHIGLVRRHSLLGVGSAVSALFELIRQLEEALYHLPFEDFSRTNYNLSLPSKEYLSFFKEPGLHNPNMWVADSNRKSLINSTDPTINASKLPRDFFFRLPFYSGRLGFREYDLSATAAIQVLIDSNSLEWHVINYTHEIIHNHVRIILNNLIIPPSSTRDSIYEQWLSHYLDLLEQVYKSPSQVFMNLSYKDYFVLTLINFCISGNYRGSLSMESHYSLLTRIHATIHKVDYNFPLPQTLRKLILNSYKDISEIFVHVIDYSYVYLRNLREYVLSIWLSWSTETAVVNDIKQYVLRTLLIISLEIEGTAYYRYEKSKLKFIEILNSPLIDNRNSNIFSRIRTILNDNNEKDLKLRYNNCLVVADMVNLFFVGQLQKKIR